MRPHVVSTPIDDGAVLLDLETKYFYRLNSSAWAVVQLLESGAVADDIVSEIKRHGAPATADDDVTRLIEFMTGERLITSLSVANSVDPPRLETELRWAPPSIERQAEPLHRVISSAFDPSIPLAE